jgi:beta-fructofuranosidase
VTQQRPRLHFTARRGWINDPIGLTYRHGTYHVFFQYLPGQTTWSPSCHWGHATSADLLRWTECPVALAPAKGEDGCWSGCVVAPTDGSDAAMFYTSVSPPDHQLGSVRRARPVDDTWLHWRADGDPVAELPAHVKGVRMRDPFVFADGSGWRMLVGAGLLDGMAAALTYFSADLRSWRYDGVLAQRSTDDTEPVWTGTMWECPQLFSLGDRHILLVSVWDADVLHYVAYGIGDYRGGRFEADTWRRLTYGPSHYAATSFLDTTGRRGMLTWLREVDDPNGTWAGALSLPMLLSVDRVGADRVSGGRNRLVATPHPNLDRLRQPVDALSSDRLASAVDIEWRPRAMDERLQVKDRSGTVVDVQRIGLQLTVASSRGVTLRRWSMPDTGEMIRIVIDGPVASLFARSGIVAIPLNAVVPPLTAVSDPRTVAMWVLT